MKEINNPFDLFKYSSIRKESISFLFTNFLINLIALSNGVIVGIIGFNATLNQTLINISELLSLPFLILLIPNIRRKKSGFIATSICSISSFLTIFIHVPSNCENCSSAFFQMMLILITRFLFYFQICVFQVSQTEFYPVSIRSIGIGAGGIF